MILSMKGLCPWAVVYNFFLSSQHKFSHMLLSELPVCISSLVQRFTGFNITMLSNTIWRILQWFPGQTILCNCFQDFSMSATTTHLLHGPGQSLQRGHINYLSLAENHLLTALTVPINLQFSNSFCNFTISTKSARAAEIGITVSVSEGLQASLDLSFFWWGYNPQWQTRAHR